METNIRRLVSTGFLVLATVALIAVVLARVGRSRGDEVVVSAASSLTDVLSAMGGAYHQAHPQSMVRFNFASSGVLQRQIEQGAPVDLYIPASSREMDTLEQEKRIEPGTRTTVAGNRLVLIVPRGGSIHSWNDLGLPSVHRIAISDPASVPSGRYARDTLTHRGLWKAVQSKLVMGENVRQTLSYVSDGDVDAGMVFATDARITGAKIRVVETALPGQDHTPILYPAALIQGAPDVPAARRFLLFLKSPAARSILVRYGFSPAGG